MQNHQEDIKEIRSNIIKGLTSQYLPAFIVGTSESLLNSTPGIKLLFSMFSVIAAIFFLYGYVVCADAIDEYAIYKGYKNYWFVYSILNIFGLSILFLFKNKNLARNNWNDKEPLYRFSIAAIFYSYLAIPLLIIPIYYIIAFIIMGSESVEYLQEDPDFDAFTNFISIPIAWYFFREMRNAKLDYRIIFGSFKKLNWKLPVGLGIIEYFFARGINSITLYGVSFLFPEYIDSLINREYTTAPISWILVAISSLIYAPIMEELFFRGIIFQKIAIKKSMSRGVLISAIAFALIHFRYDLIPLSLFGVISAILYFRTKQLATPILYHFTYNLIVISRRIYFQVFPNRDTTINTVLEYQQHVREHIGLYFLFIAVSVPYLIYFIYKNLPRNNDIDKLPYFANQ